MLKSNVYPVHSCYEAWRITYQSSEQAARAAYALANELEARYDNLLARIEKHGAVFIERCRAGDKVVWDVEISALESEIVRLRAENDGLKNRVQILEGLPNSRIPPDRVQLDEHRYIVRNGGNGWLLRCSRKNATIGLGQQTNEIIDACLGCKP